MPVSHVAESLSIIFAKQPEPTTKADLKVLVSSLSGYFLDVPKGAWQYVEAVMWDSRLLREPPQVLAVKIDNVLKQFTQQGAG